MLEVEMPYSSMEDVNPAVRGIDPPVTLAQANLIARMADGMKGNPDVDNPWAAAIGQFKHTHRMMDGKWVKKAPVSKMMMSMDEKEHMIRMAWEEKFLLKDKDGNMMHGVKVYDDFVIAKEPHGMIRYPYTLDEMGVMFDRPEKGEMEYVVAQKFDEIKELLKGWISSKPTEDDVRDEFELTVPILKADEDKRLVYGVVLRAGKVDHQGDITSAEEVEKAAHNWMKNGLMLRIGLMDDQHREVLPVERACPVAHNLGQIFDVFGGSFLIAVYIYEKY